MLSPVHLISMIFTLCLVTFVGVFSLRRIKSASDFSVGGRAITAPLVVGTIMGTLVGGASTIGTSQLAFNYGLSAWWFTLGAGIGCLLLGLFLAKPLRESGATTGPGFLAEVYGDKAGLLASIFSSAGIFLNIIAQILAAVALITSISPMAPFAAALTAVFLVITYVIFGGVWGTGLVGTLKVFLLYISMVVVGVTAFHLAGGIPGYLNAFEPFPWFSLFGRGMGVDLAAVFSMVVGVLSTQTYLQAMFSGKNVRESRLGAVISGLIIPPIGIAGILVGMYMRSSFPGIESREALPLFVLNFLPDWLGGIIIATLLVAVIGTGAGLVLGVSTMLSQDIFKNFFYPAASERQVLLFSRMSIIGVTVLTLFFVAGNMNSLILKWSFLSMGLRGATICFPLLGAVFFRKLISSQAGAAAVFLGPLSTVVCALLGFNSIDPLFIGLIVSFVVLLIGSLRIIPHYR